MIVGNSRAEYILVRAIPIALGYTGLLCFGYFIIAALTGGIRAIIHPVSLTIEILGVVEALWYLGWFLPYRHYLQRRPDPESTDEFITTTLKYRREMVMEWLDFVPDLEEYIRGWVNWAHMEDIRRDNIKEWLLWSLFGREKGFGVDDDELEGYIDEIERRLGFAIKPGRGSAEPLRLGLDRVKMSHRSLVFYFIIGFIDFLTTTFLLIRGFSFYHPARTSFFTVFPFRPLTLLSPNASAAPELSYFYRRHTSTTHRPIVFFHGVGIGLATYLPWLLRLPRDVGILAIELLPVSNRLCPAMLSGEEMADAMYRILAGPDGGHGSEFDDFVFVGHSYGTLFLSALLRHRQVSRRIDSIVLIDPVPFLLHLPHVAYNLTRRLPQTAVEWGLWWGWSQDPMVAHTLARRTEWSFGSSGGGSSMALWREQLVGRRTTVVIGSEDILVHPKAVASYVSYGDVEWHDQTEVRVEAWNTSVKKWTAVKMLELIYMEGLHHGQAFFDNSWLSTIQHVVEMYCDRNTMLGDSQQKMEQRV